MFPAVDDYRTFAANLITEPPDVIHATCRALARTDLFFLLWFILGREDMAHPWLLERCREVQEEPDGYLDLWAREHRKTSIITMGKTIQDILIDPEITIGIFSHTRPIAKSLLRQIKREFENNSMLQQLFPDILYEHPSDYTQWSEDSGIVVKRKGNPKEATVEAFGLVDGQPTGRHYKTRVYDDVVVLESVNTADQIYKTTAAWEMSDNLGVEGGKVRMIGTRYSLFDTYSEILKRGAAKPRIYPATHNGRMDGTPVLFSPQEWQRRLKTQSRPTIASQLLQNPLADEDATFSVLWLKPYEVRPRTLNVYIMCDPSKGLNSSSDNTAIIVIGVSSTGNKYLIDGFCHRMTLSQRWVALRDTYKRWAAEPGVMHIEVGYERYGAQSDDEYFEERKRLEMKSDKIVGEIVIHELSWTREGTKGEQGKRTRVERLEPDFRNGRFLLPLSILHNGKPHTWKVDTNPDSKTYQTIIYKEVEGLTKQQLQALNGGSPDLVCKSIKRYDEEDKTYDLTAKFIQEYIYFPFGEYKDALDACFVAGTMIATKRGNIPIEQVTANDSVLTPDGWCRVLGCRMTGIKPVIENIGLCGTVNHPVFHVDRGYVRLDTISSVYDTMRLSICDLLRMRLLSLLSSIIFNTKGWEDAANIIYQSAPVISLRGISKDCMSLFGNFILGKKFLKAFMFIIKIMTLLISTLAIWSAYQLRCIFVCPHAMMQRSEKSIWRKFAPLRWLGIAQRRGGSGIGNMLRKHWISIGFREHMFVRNVIRSLFQATPAWLNTAPHLAGIMHEKNLDIKGLVIKSNVNIAEKNTWGKLPRQNSVPKHAQITAVDGLRKVYNLTVEGAECYFANGILVHNCSRLYDMDIRPPVVMLPGSGEPAQYWDS